MADIKTNLEDGVFSISIAGDIAGEQSYPSIPEDTKQVSLFLGNVSYINSSGIRGWIQWGTKAFDNHTLEIIVYDCPECFIEQMNVLLDMMPSHAKIHSFQVPYYIDELDEIRHITYEKGDHFYGSDVKVKEEIEVDGYKAEIDVDPNDYFLFLNNRK